MRLPLTWRRWAMRRRPGLQTAFCLPSARAEKRNVRAGGAHERKGYAFECHSGARLTCSTACSSVTSAIISIMGYRTACDYERRLRLEVMAVRARSLQHSRGACSMELRNRVRPPLTSSSAKHLELFADLLAEVLLGRADVPHHGNIFAARVFQPNGSILHRVRLSIHLNAREWRLHQVA